MRISRRRAIAGIASGYATIGAFRFPAGAAEFNFKWGLFAPLTNPVGSATKDCADKITQESGGRLEIKVFPSFQLGSDESMVQQVRTGALELLAISNGSFSQVIPALAITVVPFVFENSKQAWSAMDGPFGVRLRSMIEKANFYVFEKTWELGNKSLNIQPRAIEKPDDLKGLKIRTEKTPVPVATFKALGASPTPLAADQIYVSLQTHLVDGLDADPVSVETLKFYEVAKYISLTRHVWTGLQNIASVDAMQRLPKNLRDLLERRVNEAIVQERNAYQGVVDSTVGVLKGQGVSINQPDVSAFKTVIRNAGLYSQWKAQYGTDVWALLEKSVGPLA